MLIIRTLRVFYVLFNVYFESIRDVLSPMRPVKKSIIEFKWF